jgi:hypothetical protein
MSSKIYYIQRHDFEDWEDEAGRLSFQSAHATVALANAEAKALLHFIFEEEDEYKDAAIREEGLLSNGCYQGTIAEGENSAQPIDLCVVTVEETVLNGGIVKVVGEDQARKRLRTDGEVEVKEDEGSLQGEATSSKDADRSKQEAHSSS